MAPLLRREPQLTTRSFSRDLAFSAVSGASSLFLLGFLVLVARALGPDGFGRFTYAFAVAGIAGLFVDFGYPALLTRDMTLSRDASDRLLGAALLGQRILYVVGTAGAMGLVALLGADLELVAATGGLTATSALRSMKSTLRGTLRAWNRFDVEAYSLLIERLLTLGVGILALVFDFTLAEVVLGYVAVRLLEFAALLVWVHRRLVRIRVRVAGDVVLSVAKRSFPLALMNGIWIVYAYVDMLMLVWMKGTVVTGIYGAAYRIYEGAAVFPIIIGATVLTSAAEALARGDRAEAARVTRQGTRYLFLIAAVSLAVGIAWSGEICELLFGVEFALSAAPLLILLVALFFGFACEIGTTTMLALHRERKTPLIYLGGLAFNILINLVLIPRWGAAGAATATAISEAFCLALFLVLLRRDYWILTTARGGLKVALVGGATLGAAILLKSAGMSVGPAIVVAAIVALAAFVFLARGDAEDRELLGQILGRGGGRAS